MGHRKVVIMVFELPHVERKYVYSFEFLLEHKICALMFRELLVGDVALHNENDL